MYLLLCPKGVLQWNNVLHARVITRPVLCTGMTTTTHTNTHAHTRGSLVSYFMTTTRTHTPTLGV